MRVSERYDRNDRSGARKVKNVFRSRDAGALLQCDGPEVTSVVASRGGHDTWRLLSTDAVEKVGSKRPAAGFLTARRDTQKLFRQHRLKAVFGLILQCKQKCGRICQPRQELMPQIAVSMGTPCARDYFASLKSVVASHIKRPWFPTSLIFERRLRGQRWHGGCLASRFIRLFAQGRMSL
jgi:hypothetical protein